MDIAKINVKSHSIEEYIEAAVFLMNYLKEYLLVPGKVENWIDITDMGKLSIRRFPLKSVVKIMETLEKLSRCRIGQSLVLNTPKSMRFLWDCTRPFLDKHNREKVIFQSENTQVLLDFFHPDQVEEKFGGNAPNLVTFWPPCFPKNFPENPSQKRTKISFSKFYERSTMAPLENSPEDFIRIVTVKSEDKTSVWVENSFEYSKDDEDQASSFEIINKDECKDVQEGGVETRKEVVENCDLENKIVRIREEKGNKNEVFLETKMGDFAGKNFDENDENTQRTNAIEEIEGNYCRCFGHRLEYCVIS